MTKAYSYIRFSTPDQLKGDSLRRQADLSRKYAEDKGLEFDESLTIKDLGVSAYKSSNFKEGALGAFLQAVRSGRIDKGSYLLVESLDRLSRATVFVALGQFMSIIKDGIVIVTLSDQRVYKLGELDEQQLMFSIMDMSRAHRESEMKSKRIAASWKNKREHSNTRKLTARAPAWLKLTEDRSEFKVIPERMSIIRLIYKLTINGYGRTRIIKKLNAQNVRVFGRGAGWHESYISKILHNRAVLGEFQPHHMVDDKRVACGEPVSGYFPKIISESDFHKAQEAMKLRVLRPGPKGAKVSNLFTNIVKCAYCGNSMRFQDKGPTSKGGKRLVCSGAIRGYGCLITRGWKYENFEKTVLANLSELDINDFLNNDSRDVEISELKINIEEIKGEIQENHIQLNRVSEAFKVSERAPEVLVELASSLEGMRETLLKVFMRKNMKLDKMLSSYNDIEQKKQDIRSLLDILDAEDADILLDIRTRLSQALFNLVEEISVYTIGDNRIEGGSPPCYKITIRNGGSQFIEQDLDNLFQESIVLRKLPAPILLSKSN